MDRLTIDMLQSARDYPSVSITLPTHRTSPANQQDPIRLRNMVHQATERLLGEFSKHDVARVLENLDRAVADVDFRHSLDGLAVFANRDHAHTLTVPCTLPERVAIDESFMIRDLMQALYRLPHYWVLVLAEQPTRLFEGNGDALVELQGGGFPMTYDDAGLPSAIPGGIDLSNKHDEHLRQFFRSVDQAFGHVAKDSPQRLVLVGVDRNLGFFKEVTSHAGWVIGTVTGSHDKTTHHELAKHVWPTIEAAMDAERGKSLEELEGAVNAQRYASGLNEAWRAAGEGRGSLLLVEENYEQPARVEGGLLTSLDSAESESGPGVLADAVDELVETVLSKGGRVVFTAPGSLAKHGKVALVTRY